MVSKLKKLFILVIVALMATGLGGTVAAQEDVTTPESNGDWEVVEQEFNGTVMVLVPEGPETAPFWLDRFEVPFSEFQGIDDPDCRRQRHLPFERYISNGAEHPIICITFDEAIEHCESRGARLPTEQEWEWAAAGPDGLAYPWGNELEMTFANINTDSLAGGQTVPVNDFPGTASWVGAQNLIGNVSEIVSGGQGGVVLVKGWSWDEPASMIDKGIQDQGGVFSDYKGNTLGFRCAQNY